MCYFCLHLINSNTSCHNLSLGLTRLWAKRKLVNEGKCEGIKPHTSKGTSTLGVWSPDGFRNLQRGIAGVKTQCIEKFFILLESY
jgi:hypothetical protein